MLFAVFVKKKPKWMINYEGGLTPWYIRQWNDREKRYVITSSFSTKEEALEKLEEIKDTPYYYD